MEDLCRLCLSISNEMYKFSDDLSITHKIQSCFSLIMECNTSLPNQTCKLCLNKVNETYEFQKQIIENQNLLLDHLKKENNISNLYVQLRNKIKIKKEPDILINGKESKQINIPKTDFDYNIKVEFDNVETYISDDEVLSKIKEDKIKTVIKIEQKNIPVIKSHKCLTCFQLFETQGDLTRHYKTEHVDEKETEQVTKYTTVKENRSVVYKCNVCCKDYSRKKNILRHMIGHSDLRPYLCKLCGRTYKTVSEIIRHGRVHGNTKLFCSYKCGYSTVYIGALRAHERRHGEAKCKYQCEKCNKGFEVRTWYEQHQNIHTGIKPFVCDICGLAFHMDRYLTAHRSSVHPQTSNLKKYMCVHCSLPCDSKNALTEHLEIHGKIKTRFLCDLCGETLSNAEQLKFHKRTHLGEKPYSCSTCSKSFTKKFNLKVHQRTHTGERAYVCIHCGRKYTQKSTLIRHLSRSHAGTEPMDCSNCQKSFATKRLLHVHQNICTTSTDCP